MWSRTAHNLWAQRQVSNIGKGCGAGLLTICGHRDEVQILVKDAVPVVKDCKRTCSLGMGGACGLSAVVSSEAALHDKRGVTIDKMGCFFLIGQF